MKTLTTSLLAALALPAAADIITLKDGTKLDATILEKNLEELVLEVNVTKSIKERRTIKRSDVADIEETNQAEAIFEEKVKGLTPAPPFLELKDYDERIKVIKSFLRSHRTTRAGTKATTMLSELEKEREFIAAGGLKTSLEPSGLIKPEDREKDAIGIAASIEATKVKELLESRSYIAALRQYAVMEQRFFGTAAHREVLPLISSLVNSYAALLSRELTNASQREERRQVTLDQLSGSDRDRAIQAEDLRVRRMAAIWEKEEAEGQQWLTVDTQSVDSLEDTISALEKEAERLAAVSEEVAEIEDQAQLYRDGWIAAGEKNLEALETILNSMDEIGVEEDFINALVDRFDPTINNPPAEEETDEEPSEEEAAEEESDISE